MIQKALNKARAYGAELNLSVGDALDTRLAEFDCVMMNYTLQFIRPPRRAELVCKIYRGLNEGGTFVFSEKIIFEDKKFAKNMIEIYENYKAEQGYTRFEIAQKREALENVLIPYTEAENRALALDAGFKRVESVFKWGNFMTFIAFK